MKHFRKWAVKLALSIAAFWFAARGLDAPQLSAMLKSQHPGGLVLAVLLILAQVALGSIRWRMAMRALAAPGESAPSRFEMLKLYYIGAFFNCCLPGTVGGDVVRVWLAKSDHVPLTLSIHSVIVDRLISLAALLALSMFTVPWLAGILDFSPWAVWLPAAALAAFGLWFLFRIERLFTPFAHVRLVHIGLHFIRCVRLLFRHPRLSFLSLLMGMASHVCFCASVYALAVSFGADISLLQCITLIPPVLLAVTLPISIGGWGVREVGMVGLLGLAGIPSAAALTLSVQLGLLGMLVMLPAGLLWLTYRKRSGRP